MAKKGPCFHCGVDSSPLWRKGPAHKPVLCNACGTHYNLKGNLQNYLPKSLRIHSQNNKSKKAAPKESSDFWNNIPRRKRSVVVFKRMTPMEIFQRQLLSLYRWQSQTPNESFPEEENVLVYNTNNFIGTNEIGLGAVLLKADPGPSFPCSSSADNQAQPHSSTIEP